MKSIALGIALASPLALSASALADLAYGVTQTNALVSFNTATPGTLISGFNISGLQSNETIIGIDFRPATGQLYALGSTSRLYTLNTSTGAATPISASAFVPGLNGSSFGFDFNPTVDRIRIVSDADQNLRVHPLTGAVVATDVNLAYNVGDVNFGINPNVVHAAYTNSFAGATTTQLFVLDTGTDVLALQNANAGTLTTIGSVGADLTDVGGFDISPNGNTAFAVVRNAVLSRSTFWSINLSNGSGSMIGEVGGGAVLTALAVIPSPGAAALMGLAGLTLAGRRRR